MREIALSTITTMLAIYTAILVIAWQHVSDQYTPKVLPAFLRYTACYPLIGFAVLLLLSGVLVLHPLQIWFAVVPAKQRIHLSPLVGDVIAFLFLLASVVIVVVASYNLAKYLANGTKIIFWLHNEEDKEIALREALQTAIQRDDQRVTAAILSMILSNDQFIETNFLIWLSEHQGLLSIDWFARELRRLLLYDEFDATRARNYAALLSLLLKRAMDDEAFPRAQETILSIFDALTDTTDLEQSHADLLECMGFATWKIGEIDAYALRSARIPSQLTNVQRVFISAMRSILLHVVDLNSKRAMQVFCLALAKLALVTREGEFHGPFFSTIHETLEKGFSSHLFEGRK